MNAPAPRQTVTQLERPNGGPSFSLVPQNLQQAIELSKLIAESDLAPKDYKGKPGNVLIAVQMGQEVGLAPMSAIQNIAVINGKPSIYGDAGKAILLAAGFVIEEDDIAVVKKQGFGRCKITRFGHPPCERTFSIENAKKAGLWEKSGPWTQYPERQLAWRAFWFAARDIASDVLKGLSGLEEIRDIAPERDVTASGSHTIVEQPQAASAAATAAAAAASTEQAASNESQASSQETPAASTSSSANGSQPLKAPQVNIIRVKLKNAGLTEVDLKAKFPGKVLSAAEDGEPFVFSDFNSIVEWIEKNAKS